MGVPKFFRYFSERYPCVITSHDGDAPMHFDNLYLDMNGIIHHCSHSNDVDLSKESSSHDEMARAMCVYIEKLFDVVKPKKNFLMCVDGVAPRAKMNQQRQRRFRKEYDMLEAMEKALEEGQAMADPDKVFDSNEITPGTPFMDAFSKHFKYFIARKLETDASWREVNVVFSGYDVPGEGEHKIMDFIRKRRMAPNYDTNEKHCLYGLDADLIMLALVSHEPNFVLLREVVKFESKKDVEKREELKKKGIEKESLPIADQFVLFHVETFRNYLTIDFCQHDHKMIKSFQWAPCYNDFVIMCFFVGNDFLPGVPTLNIHEGVMAKMFEIYHQDILQKGMYLTNKKKLNWVAIQVFLKKLGEKELEMINAREKEESDYNARQRRYNPTVPLKEVTHTSDLNEAKDVYYNKKFGWSGRYDPELPRLVVKWVEGIEWVWRYYVEGVPSWKWFYPYHYSPYASDIAAARLQDIATKTTFELGQPFLPFDQLLGVLPPASIRRCLPKAYHELPKKESLGYAFPQQLIVDREGTRAPWEGVVVIPFLDEKDILAESSKLRGTFTPEERVRNTNHEAILYRHDPALSSVYIPSTIRNCPPSNFPMSITPYTLPEGPPHSPAPLDKAAFGRAVGFTSIFSKHFTTYMKQEITIFDKKSFKDSVIIKLDKAAPAEKYKDCIHKWVWVGWPHYRYARINTIMDRKVTIRKGNSNTGTPVNNNPEQARAFDNLANEHRLKLLAKRGIAVDVTVLVSVRFLAGFCTIKNEFHKKMTQTETLFPIQLVKLDANRDTWSPLPFIPLEAAARNEQRDEKMLPQLPVMYLPQVKSHEEWWGCVGEVIKPEDQKCISISLQAARPCPELPNDLITAIDTSAWVTLKEIAEGLRIAPRVLELLCGSITTTKPFGSKEIGLCLVVKSEDKQYSRLGCAKIRMDGVRNPVDTAHYMTMGTKDCVLTRLADRVGGGNTHMETGNWIVSSETRAVIEMFCMKFNPILAAASTQNNNSFDPQELRTGKWEKRDAAKIVQEIEQWVKEQVHWRAPLVGATEDIVPPMQLKKLEEALMEARTPPVADLKLKVHKQMQDVYAPFFYTKEHMFTTLPGKFESKEMFRLGARVVNMKAIGSIPFGARGVIVRLLSDSATAEVVLDDEYLGATTLNGRLKTYRGVLLKRSQLLPVRRLPKTTIAAKSPQKAVMQIAGGVGSEAHKQGDAPPTAPSPSDTTLKLPADVADALGVASIGAKKMGSPESALSPSPMSPQIISSPPEPLSEVITQLEGLNLRMTEPVISVADMRKGFHKSRMQKKARRKTQT